MSVDTPGAVRPWTVVGYMAGRVIPGVILVLSVSVWLRSFSAEVYGVFSILQAAVLAVSALATGWLRQALLRFAGRTGHGLLDHPRWVVAATVLAVAAGVVVTGGVVTRWSLGGAAWAAAALFAVSYAAYLLAQVTVQRDGEVLRFNSAEILRVGGALGLSLGLHAVGVAPLTAIVLGNALGNVVGFVVCLRPGSIRERRIGRRSAAKLARASWQFGWPMSVWLGVASLTAYVDRFVLGLYATPGALGRYTAAADLVVRGLTMLALPFVMAVHPIIMREHNQGRVGEAGSILRSWQIRLLAALGTAVLLTAVVGPQVLRLVLGQATISRATLVVLAAGAALIQFSPLAHKKLEIAQRTKRLMVYALVALSVEVGMSLALVQPLKALGVATGVLAGSLTYLALTWLGQRRAAAYGVDEGDASPIERTRETELPRGEAFSPE